MSLPKNLTKVLPDTATVDENGHLIIGGCDTIDLASEFGTPLYIFDELTLRQKCREYRKEFSQNYANTSVIYASKALINQALVKILKEEEMGLDVVSGGELFIAKSVDFPMSKVFFHGNNKSLLELKMALDWGVGRIVVDNFHELTLLDDAAQKAGVTQSILLRLSPGIDPHTHKHTTTGILDSKFGFPIVTGQAEQALAEAMSAANLNLVGLHIHLGSPIFETEPFKQAIEVVFQFAREMMDKHHFKLQEFSPGGGFAIPYTHKDPSPKVSDYAKEISASIKETAGKLALDLPDLIIEPGRSIVGRAGVALYKTGATKEIPGGRKYVSLDGGMSDNIRPALYDSKYEAMVANNLNSKTKEKVSLAGKFCESGDILVKDIDLPIIKPDDLIAIPVSGAYCLSMSSNYNASLGPAVVMVNNNEARLIQRRETYDDLTKRDES